MHSPEVTIAIPVYNVEPYVEKSLLSALNQNFDRPYEILIVDDCGDDKSMDVVKRVLEKHQRRVMVRIIEHEANRGLGEARNTAILQAQGRYLFFLDSDDWLSSDCLQHLYHLAELHHADVVAGSTQKVEGDEIQPLYQLRDEVIHHDAAGVWLLLQRTFMNIEVWNKLFRLSFLRDNCILTTHRIMEDSVFDFQVRALAKTLVLSSRPTLYYNTREGSILTSIFGKKATDDVLTIYCDIIQRTQKLITSDFKSIPGIYDLYCLRLFYTFFSIRKMELSPSQEHFINTTLVGFTQFIPGFHALIMGTSRFAWLSSKLCCESWKVFEYIYRIRYTRKHHYIAQILAKL